MSESLYRIDEKAKVWLPPKSLPPWLVKVEPDAKTIAALLDELLAYCPEYFRDKWGLDTAVAEAKVGLGVDDE